MLLLSCPASHDGLHPCGTVNLCKLFRVAFVRVFHPQQKEKALTWGGAEDGEEGDWVCALRMDREDSFEDLGQVQCHSQQMGLWNSQ